MLLPSEEGVQFFFPESLAGKAPRPTEPVVALRLVLGGKKAGKGPSQIWVVSCSLLLVSMRNKSKTANGCRLIP